MYFTNKQPQAAVLVTAIQICVDCLDGLTTHDYVDDFSPVHQSMIDGIDDFKNKLYDAVRSTNYVVSDLSDPVFTPDFINLALNYVYDFVDGNAHHDFIDHVGSSYVKKPQYDAVKDFIRSCA